MKHVVEAVEARRVAVVDGLLRVVPDRRYEFEELALVTIAITATDGGGLSLTEVFAINVIADNEAPQSISVAVQMVPENARGAVVGAIIILIIYRLVAGRSRTV